MDRHFTLHHHGCFLQYYHVFQWAFLIPTHYSSFDDNGHNCFINDLFVYKWLPVVISIWSINTNKQTERWHTVNHAECIMMLNFSFVLWPSTSWLTQHTIAISVSLYFFITISITLLLHYYKCFVLHKLKYKIWIEIAQIQHKKLNTELI